MKLLLAPVLLLFTSVESFVLRPSEVSNAIHQSRAPLYMSYDPYHSDDDPLARNKARTDIRNLLTQRSIQSFVYLLNNVRDVHTARWIEQALEFNKLDSFHGTGALNMTRFPSWDSFFLDMVTMEKETVVIITKKQKAKDRGWSNKAGYLDDLAKKSSLEKSIKTTTNQDQTTSALPKRAHRGYNNAGYLRNLSSAKPDSNTDNETKEKHNRRDKAGRNKGRVNAATYLDNLGKSNDTKSKRIDKKKKASSEKSPLAPRPFSSGGYLTNLSNMQQPEPKKETPKKSKQKKQKPEEIPEYEQRYEFDIDPASLVNRIISVREQLSREWVNDLETLVMTNDEILTSYLDRQIEARNEEEDDQETKDLTSPYSDKSSENLVFDKSALLLLANSIASQDRDSSPFRRPNFDLLLLSSTQESIHRVLREYSKEDAEEDFDWLREFYTERVGKFFDGHGQAYGRADDFLGEMLTCPPTVQEKNGGIHLIDPMKMVEDIIRERSEVAREWTLVVSTSTDDHLDLRRLLLTRRMNEVDDMPSFFTKSDSKKKKSKEDLFDIGAFE